VAEVIVDAAGLASGKSRHKAMQLDTKKTHERHQNGGKTWHAKVMKAAPCLRRKREKITKKPTKTEGRKKKEKKEEEEKRKQGRNNVGGRIWNQPGKGSTRRPNGGGGPPRCGCQNQRGTKKNKLKKRERKHRGRSTNDPKRDRNPRLTGKKDTSE